MKILFTFPGQGTQHPDMLQNLPGTELAQAREVLGAEIDSLDSPTSLRHTRAVQLSLLIAGVAWARELERRGVSPDIVSGLSIGAYPAAVVAGALDFADALRLVALRGDLMEQAYPHGYGLTAIMGLTLSQVESLVEGSGTWIANLNAETQIVIAGSDEAMAGVAKRALEKGASKAHRLAVSVPSHCELLAEPAQKLVEAFSRVTLSSALRLSQRQHRARTVAAGAYCRRSGDEYGAHGALAGGGDFRQRARGAAGDRDAAGRRTDLLNAPGGVGRGVYFSGAQRR